MDAEGEYRVGDLYSKSQALNDFETVHIISIYSVFCHI